jgi:dTDP-4-dehydrorhamnose reductase
LNRILLIGKNGQVGWELQRTLAPLGNVIALDSAQLNLTQPDAIRTAISETAPDIIVNAAGYTKVDQAESELDLAMQINGVAPGIIAEEAAKLDALLVHYSTDYVFDGTKSTPYTEDDAPNPINTYGRTKLAGEQAITAVGGKHLILRTSWIYSARRENFVLAILRLARERKTLSVVDDQIGSPTWARALAAVTAAALQRQDRCADKSRTYHLSAEGHVSRCEFAETMVALAREASGVTDGWAGITPTAGSAPAECRHLHGPDLPRAGHRHAPLETAIAGLPVFSGLECAA